jgi:hypothetical protein
MANWRFWAVEVPNRMADSVLPAKLHAKSGFLEASPKNLLCGRRVVTKLLPERFLVRQVVDLFHPEA